MSSKTGGHYMDNNTRRRGVQQPQRGVQQHPQRGVQGAQRGAQGAYRGGQHVPYSPPYFRRALGVIDKFLFERGLKRKYIAKDGSCLFRAVSEQVWLVQAHHWTLRRQTALYIKGRKDRFKSFLTEPVDDYCFRLSNSSMWGGEMELVALSEFLDRHIIVYSEEKGSVKVREFNQTKASDEKSIKLAYTGSNHYDGVWGEIDERVYGFCQSIVYDVLYSQIFKNQGIVSKSRNLSLSQTMYSSNWGPPQDLLKALSCFVFSNIPIEHARIEKIDREKRDRQFASSLQFRTGTICDVSLDNGVFRAEILSNYDYPKIKVKLIENGRKPFLVSSKQIVFSHNNRRGNGGRDQRRSYSNSRGQTEGGEMNRRDDPPPQRNERSSREEKGTRDQEKERKSKPVQSTGKTNPPTVSERKETAPTATTVPPSGRGEGRTSSPKPPGVKSGEKRPPGGASTRDKGREERERGRGEGGEGIRERKEGVKSRETEERRDEVRRGEKTRERPSSRGSENDSKRAETSSKETTSQSVNKKTSEGGGTTRNDRSTETERKAHTKVDPPKERNASPAERRPQRKSPNPSSGENPVTVTPPPPLPPATDEQEPHPPIDVERGLIYQMAHGERGMYYMQADTSVGGGAGGYLYPIDVFTSTGNNHILITSSSSGLPHHHQHPPPCFTEAPECEWPILDPDRGASTKLMASDHLHPKPLHIDGPPPQPLPESFLPHHVGLVQSGHHHVPPPTHHHLLVSDLEPPLHILQNRTQEEKQAFMFEYAQKCLRYYFDSLSGEQPEIEDVIEELMSMSLEDFLMSPSRYTDGELTTTSPDNSELTDEREASPLRMHTGKAEETVSPSRTSDNQPPPPPRDPGLTKEDERGDNVANGGEEEEVPGDEGVEEEGMGGEEMEEEEVKSFLPLPNPYMMPYQPMFPMMYPMPHPFFGYPAPPTPYRMPPPSMMIPHPFYTVPPPHPHLLPNDPQEGMSDNDGDVNDNGEDTPPSQSELKATPIESKVALTESVNGVPERSSLPSSPRPTPPTTPPPPPSSSRQPDKQFEHSKQHAQSSHHHGSQEYRHRGNQDSRHHGNQERTSKSQKSKSYHASRNRAHQQNSSRQHNND